MHMQVKFTKGWLGRHPNQVTQTPPPIRENLNLAYTSTALYQLKEATIFVLVEKKLCIFTFQFEYALM